MSKPLLMDAHDLNAKGLFLCVMLDEHSVYEIANRLTPCKNLNSIYIYILPNYYWIIRFNVMNLL